VRGGGQEGGCYHYWAICDIDGIKVWNEAEKKVTLLPLNTSTRIGIKGTQSIGPTHPGVLAAQRLEQLRWCCSLDLTWKSEIFLLFFHPQPSN